LITVSDKTKKLRRIDGVLQNLNKSYRSLVMTQNPKNAHPFMDQNTLVLCGNWLAWQFGPVLPNVIPYETALLKVKDVANIDTNLYERTDSWVYHEGKDITVFEGVSLGKSFQGSLALTVCNLARLFGVLSYFVKTYNIKEIIYIDFTPDVDITPVKLRSSAIKIVSSILSVRFIDKSQTLTNTEIEISDSYSQEPTSNFFIMLLRDAYVKFLCAFTYLRSLSTPKRFRVLICVGTSLAEPLMLGLNKNSIEAIFMARVFRKTFKNILGIICRPILAENLDEKSLTPEQNDKITEICEGVSSIIYDSDDFIVQFCRKLFVEHFAKIGAVDAAARQINSAKKFLQRVKPDRIIVDGIRNPPTRTIAEIAHTMDIPVDYIWHSILVPQYIQIPGLVGDRYTPPLISRCLSWGSTNDRWLKRTNVKTPCLRVGSPVSARYQKRPNNTANKLVLSPSTNILILQYAPIVSDPKSMNARLYEYFVDSHLLLQAQKFENLLFKLHPGPKRWKPSYFQAIADQFGFKAVIIKKKPFHSCVSWADIVIGPPQTGAMFETLAIGKPYYPVIYEPHCFDLSFYDDYPIYSSIQAVIDSMLAGYVPNGKKLLNSVYSTDDIPNSTHEFWGALDSTGPDNPFS